MKPGSTVSPDDVAAQTDQLILQLVDALEGEDEAEIVRLFLQLRAAVSEGPGSAAWKRNITATRDRIFGTVNNFFYDRLTEIQRYIEYVSQTVTEAT